MPKVLNINSYSLNIKVAFSLLLISIFLLSILFLLIVPKMQKEQLEDTKDKIEKMIQVTKEQVQVAGEAISIQTILERSETKYKLQTQLNFIKDNAFDINTTKDLIKKSSILKHCSYILKNDSFYEDNLDKKINKNLLINLTQEKWFEHKVTLDDKTFNRKTLMYSFSKILDFKNTLLTIVCSEGKLNLNHRSFEEGIKKYVQNTFSLTQDFHHGKSYLIWINHKYANEANKALYNKNNKLKREKYTISNMSNVENIHTGNLSAKQILDARDKEPIEHLLNGKKALSWVKDLSEERDKNYIFLLISTIYLEDLHNHIDSSFWKILPAALLALFLAFIAGFFLLKRLFKGINILSQTAIQVNQGNRRIRSNVKGNDDIGNLGLAFDSMLDSLQNNIKTLDKKVEEKTKKLKSSLDEKELLLKEIHHRVKNNLALTIGLIKLQQTKIKDEKAKKVLKDIQERIYTMELLHRKLYESTNLNHINFQEYLESLVYDIESSYQLKQKVKIKIKATDIYLDIEKALPCGLILNELITNSFKYAFKEEKKPQLFIKVKKVEDKIHLTIRDNGKGINKDINIHNSNTLGLKLINSISRLQLKGELEYKYKKGAFFKIIF